MTKRETIIIMLTFIGFSIWGSIYGFMHREYIQAIGLVGLGVFCTLLLLKYLKVIKGLPFLEPYMGKDENDRPIFNTTDEQLGIKKVNSLQLTSDQEKFIKSNSIGAGVFGVWFFIANGLTREGLKQFIPVYGGFQRLKAVNWGRKIVWESRPWQSFTEFQKRQKLLDTAGLVIIFTLILLITGMVIYGFLFIV